MATQAERMAQDGIAALRRGDAAGARTLFERVEAAGGSSPQIRLLLAQACGRTGDFAAAHRALDAVLGAEPANLYALLMRGDLLEKSGDERAAVSWYQAALAHAPRVGRLPPDLVQWLDRTKAMVERLAGSFQRTLDDALAAAGAEGAGARFAEALEILSGRAEPQLQRPTSFYYPWLPQRPFYDPADFPWGAGLVAAAPAIRAELDAVMADEAGVVPYVEPEADRPAKPHPLLRDPRWSAYHLWQGGAPAEDHLDRCPATAAALARLPIPRIRARSPMALFSVLKPGTHIPPHWGMINTRLICHLPLIVPQNCRLRVGNQLRDVRRDELMIFDDTIEHEAWNDGATTRVVLLFEIWHPALDEAERRALTALFDVIDTVG